MDDKIPKFHEETCLEKDALPFRVFVLWNQMLINLFTYLLLGAHVTLQIEK